MRTLSWRVEMGDAYLHVRMIVEGKTWGTALVNPHPFLLTWRVRRAQERQRRRFRALERVLVENL